MHLCLLQSGPIGTIEAFLVVPSLVKILVQEITGFIKGPYRGDMSFLKIDHPTRLVKINDA